MRTLHPTVEQLNAINSAASEPCPVRKWDAAFAIRSGRWHSVTLRDLYPLFRDDRSRQAVLTLLASSLDGDDLVELYGAGGEYFEFAVNIAIERKRLAGLKEGSASTAG